MVSVFIFYADQCDKRKCTSIKIKDSSHKLPFKLGWSEDPKFIRKKSIVLTPKATQFVSTNDLDLIQKHGITILDCSWKQGDKYLDWSFSNARVLPPLVAGNPVNYGKWNTLTSLEALAASFFLVGLESEALSLVNLYNWGETFLDLNRELLENYKTHHLKDEILEIYNKYIKKHSVN
jgi:pre-rRNA-processing protein TSR3